MTRYEKLRHYAKVLRRCEFVCACIFSALIGSSLVALIVSLDGGGSRISFVIFGVIVIILSFGNALWYEVLTEKINKKIKLETKEDNKEKK